MTCPRLTPSPSLLRTGGADRGSAPPRGAVAPGDGGSQPAGSAVGGSQEDAGRGAPGHPLPAGEGWLLVPGSDEVLAHIPFYKDFLQPMK